MVITAPRIGIQASNLQAVHYAGSCFLTRLHCELKSRHLRDSVRCTIPSPILMKVRTEVHGVTPLRLQVWQKHHGREQACHKAPNVRQMRSANRRGGYCDDKVDEKCHHHDAPQDGPAHSTKAWAKASMH